MNEVTVNNEQLLRNFILENYLFTDDQSILENSESFLDSGIIDSMSILDLVCFLEETLSFKVKPDEMTRSNLDSIDNILNFVDRKFA